VNDVFLLERLEDVDHLDGEKADFGLGEGFALLEDAVQILDVG
jgi:hypothetical protein